MKTPVCVLALTAALALTGCEGMDDEDMGLLMGVAMVTGAAAMDPSGEAANTMLQGMSQGMTNPAMMAPAMVAPGMGGTGSATGDAALAMLGQAAAGGQVNPYTGMPAAGMGAMGMPSAMPGQMAAMGGGAYPPRPNTLAGSRSCAGYTVDNYKEYYAANTGGPDVQLHSLCAGAYNYYWMYLNAIRQGYSQADSDRTYAAFQDAAQVAEHFYATAR